MSKLTSLKVCDWKRPPSVANFLFTLYTHPCDMPSIQDCQMCGFSCVRISNCCLSALWLFQSYCWRRSFFFFVPLEPAILFSCQAFGFASLLALYITIWSCMMCGSSTEAGKCLFWVSSKGEENTLNDILVIAFRTEYNMCYLRRYIVSRLYNNSHKS
jgi:hypothetical protein